MRVSRRSLGRVLIVLGSLLVGVAVLVGIGTWHAEAESRRAAADVLERLERLIPDEEVGAGELAEAPLLDGHPQMTSAMLDGQSYVAVLEVPSVGLRCAVLSSAEADPALPFPRRVSGSPVDGSLVIYGRDSEVQFAHLSGIAAGDELTLRTVDGAIYHYAVSLTPDDGVSPGEGVADVTDAVLDEGTFALVLETPSRTIFASEA